jgi:hypothetical protein
MADRTGNSQTGYGNPPIHTRFTKGRSGNPKGRPKGSQNLATILAKAGRQRIKVIENGRARYITKFEASMLQLMNQAVSGDLKAIHELQCWTIALEDPDQAALSQTVLREADEIVMANLLERIRNSENVAQEITTAPLQTPPDANEK